MDLSNLTPEQTQKLKQIAAQMGINLEELLRDHDPNVLLEQYKDQTFGVLNEYGSDQGNMLNGWGGAYTLKTLKTLIITL